MAKSHDGFESLEARFYLPSCTVEIENFWGRENRRWNSREQEDVPRDLEILFGRSSSVSAKINAHVFSVQASLRYCFFLLRTNDQEWTGRLSPPWKPAILEYHQISHTVVTSGVRMARRQVFADNDLWIAAAPRRDLHD